jgi:hypothetical protein
MGTLTLLRHVHDFAVCVDGVDRIVVVDHKWACERGPVFQSREDAVLLFVLACGSNSQEIERC